MKFLLFLIIYPGVVVTTLLILFLAFRWFLDPQTRKQTEWLLVCAALVEPAASVSTLITRALSRLRPLKLDLYIYQIDCFFGSPSFYIGRVVGAHLWLIILMSVSYCLLSVAIFCTFAVYMVLRPEREALRVAMTFLFNLFAAVPLYLLFPVCGPAFAFPNFPALPPAHLFPHMMPISAAPNGVPSVHMSAALLILWFLWPWSWGRAISSIYLGLIIMSTLATGQHYLFDLLCAVPYAALVIWIVRILDDKLLAINAIRLKRSKQRLS